MPALVTGSIVRFRGREWVVLPPNEELQDTIRLRPLTGSSLEDYGAYLPLEDEDAFQEAGFPPIDPRKARDFSSAALLRDAARLRLRSGTAPLKALDRVRVRPKVYQIVPWIMALRQDTVRLLIADDVGIGKTIEAGLIAKDLLDRDEGSKLAVLCPPHLCDQWKEELENKFQVPAVIIRSGTMTQLERQRTHGGTQGGSVFGAFPFIIVSIDFVKGDRWRAAFLSECPDIVIVDEAHTCTRDTRGSSTQQRYELLRDLSAVRNRHLILLTATPHSGIEERFRSLLGLLRPEFEAFALDNLTERQRSLLARHFVQRRRGDVRLWRHGDEDTPFPEREQSEDHYDLSHAYESLLRDVWDFTRQTVSAAPGDHHRRVHRWAALALLRCIGSSPAAAAMALENRLKGDGQDDEASEGYYQDAALDMERETPLDGVPVFMLQTNDSERRKISEFLRRAKALVSAAGDTKVEKAAEIVADMLRRGFHPIVWCRFIPTAHYVADALNQRLVDLFPDIHAVAITGEFSEAQRSDLAGHLAPDRHRVLVATDCLSEGINLQDAFDAAFHYDLPWNPNRLDQRDGRVDRYGQRRPEVRSVVLYGRNNPIDGAVLNVLIKKARAIHESLGISVPVPLESESVMEAVANVLFDNAVRGSDQLTLFDHLAPVRDRVHSLWDQAADREKESRTKFAQHAVHPEEVMSALRETDAAIGGPETVRSLVLAALPHLGFVVQQKGEAIEVSSGYADARLQARLGLNKTREVLFAGLPGDHVWERTSDEVAAIAELIVDGAIAGDGGLAARSGAIFTTAVGRRTVVAILAMRYRLTRRGMSDLFAEETIFKGFHRVQGAWQDIGEEDLTRALGATPSAEITQGEREEQVAKALEALAEAPDLLQSVAREREEAIADRYNRVRQETGGRTVRVSAYPPDILGLYVLLPGEGA